MSESSFIKKIMGWCLLKKHSKIIIFMLMSVMLISIMFVNMTSAAQIKDIKGTRVERQYSNHYSAQFNELWDSFGRSEISIYDINYNINDTYNPTTFNDTNGRDSAGYEILLKVDGKEVWLGNSHYKNNEK